MKYYLTSFRRKITLNTNVSILFNLNSESIKLKILVHSYYTINQTQIRLLVKHK